MTLCKDGTELSAKEINERVYQYYSDLFRERPVNAIEANWEDRIAEMRADIGILPRLVADPISIAEVKRAVFRKMAKKKSPGNDGLPIKFYKTFWKDLKMLS
jgi:hypothetical protein